MGAARCAAATRSDGEPRWAPGIAACGARPAAPGSRSRCHSHELAQAAGVSAAQVRRDIMELGHSGNPSTGYAVRRLLADITACLDAPEGQQAALVGIGNLGRAVLAYFSGSRRPGLQVVAAFDVEPQKMDRVLLGCRCYRVEQLQEVIRAEKITVGIVAVPAEAAQQTADQLVAAGITGILNFAPVPLKVPSLVYVENVDLAVRLETVAYFARKRKG